MKNTQKIYTILTAIFVLMLTATQAFALPAAASITSEDVINNLTVTETDISSGLNSGYEPSGAVWNHYLNKLFIVGDDGDVTSMDRDGSNVQDYFPGGDLEGITIKDPTSDYLYVLVEHPDTIKQFSITDGDFTGNEWDLTSWLTGSDNQGAEGITYIPAGQHPYSSVSGGIFAVGLQADGKVYFFDLDTSTNGAVSLIDSISLEYDGSTISSDISGMDYHRTFRTLFVISDSRDALVGLQADRSGSVETWVQTVEYDVPGSNQEGIAFTDGNRVFQSVFIAEDSGDTLRYDLTVSNPFRMLAIQWLLRH